QPGHQRQQRRLPAADHRRRRGLDRRHRRDRAAEPRGRPAAGPARAPPAHRRRPRRPLRRITMFEQILAITGMNLRSVPQRWGAWLVVVFGPAGVVAVFTALLAMANGFASTLVEAGRPDNAIVLRGQSNAELNSGFGGDSTDLIKLGPGIRKGSDGRPLAAGE